MFPIILWRSPPQRFLSYNNKMRLALLSLALPVAALADCSHAPVYMFPSKGQGVTNNEQIPLFNHRLSHLALSDFIGTSSMYEVESEDDAQQLGKVRCPHSLLQEKGNTVVVVVDNAEMLFDKDDLLSKRSETWPCPKFYMENSPASDSFDEYLQHLSFDRENTPYVKWDDLTVTVPGVDSIDGIAKDFGDFISGVTDSLEKDLQYIKSLIQKLSSKQDGFVHLKALNGKHGAEYEEARTKLKEGLVILLEEAPSYNVAIITVPENTCGTFDIEDMFRKNSHRPLHDSSRMRHHKMKCSEDNTSRYGKREADHSIRIQSGFSSMEQCKSSTNNCSGHGSCVEVNSGSYQCACKSTFDDQTQRTTQWGGNACQKIDISAPFNLLLWSSVGILAVTIWAVGLMYSVGSEPLPGILGVAKKVEFK